METKDRDAVGNAALQKDWQDDENIVPADASMINEFGEDDATGFEPVDESDQRYLAAGRDNDDEDDEDDEDDDEDDDDDDDEDEDDEGDWGHVDTGEGNSPFPDSNDPSGPGSAV
jgi:hypothetical protein